MGRFSVANISLWNWKRGLVCVLSLYANAGYGLSTQRLDWEKIAYSRMHPTHMVTGLYTQGERFMSVGDAEPVLYQSVFRPEDKKFMADATFEVPDTTYVLFPKQVAKGRWWGVLPTADNSKWLLLDGSGGNVMALLAKDGSWISHRQIVADTLRPARDPRGNPISRETSAYRDRMRKSWIKATANGLVLSGWMRRPSQWPVSDEGDYVVSTQLEQAPLALMNCDAADVTQCQLVRGCNVEALRGLKTAGVAYSAAKKLLLVGLAEKRAIRVFTWQSCYNIVARGDMLLPDKVKDLRTVFVDEQDRLWIGTQNPDDYRNASVYMWNAADWGIKP